ncbi:hypothetical protein Tdes44962_MAKER03144 [Teratosphaeria destructans]|uniref:Uncharacterized protein n=1 Tax=Teratosphaeria destructans TaxID=418781 RepID=A0A9W7SR47_9PEZI|nr:hypothetical protein Tdes44962_MAKER03144 [Teratosphaeria destructans]
MATKLTQDEIDDLLPDMPEYLRNKKWGIRSRTTAQFLRGGLQNSYEMSPEKKELLKANCKTFGVHNRSPPDAKKLAALCGDRGADDLTGWSPADQVLMDKVLTWVSKHVNPPEEWDGQGRWLSKGEVQLLIEGALARTSQKRGTADKVVAESSRMAVQRAERELDDAAEEEGIAHLNRISRKRTKGSKTPIILDSESDDGANAERNDKGIAERDDDANFVLNDDDAVGAQPNRPPPATSSHSKQTTPTRPPPSLKPDRPFPPLSLRINSARPSKKTALPQHDFDFDELVAYLQAERLLPKEGEVDEQKVLELGQKLADRKVQDAEKGVRIWARKVEALEERLKEEGLYSDEEADDEEEDDEVEVED